MHVQNLVIIYDEMKSNQLNYINSYAYYSIVHYNIKYCAYTMTTTNDYLLLNN